MQAKANIRHGYYSELSRNESFGLSMDKAKTLCEKVYAALIAYGDMTAEQIGEKIHNHRVYVIHARLNELMAAGLVIDTEKKIINPDTKKPNTLWHALPGELILEFR